VKIGIDFDNTIVSYEKSLMRIASRLGIKNISNPGLAKQEIKKKLNEGIGRDYRWQKIQGLLYGRLLKYADPMPGVLNFLSLCRVRGCEVFIVSHKTEFGHFDKTKTSLRESALGWIDAKLIDGFSNSFFSHNNIYFASSQEEKINLIKQLDFDFFIDDLDEVLDKINHENLKKLLFSNIPDSNGLSWREISLAIFGVFTEKDCAKVFNLNFPDENIFVEKIADGGNSRIFKINRENGAPVALKKYPPHSAGDRSRQFVETLAYRVLQNSIFIPKLLHCDFITGYNLYSWVDGEKIQNFGTKELDVALGFIGELIRQTKLSNEIVPIASEACLAPADIFSQIEYRLNDLAAVDDRVLKEFLINSFIPIYELAHSKFISNNGSEFIIQKLQEENWVLSPSDFGFHNSLKSNKGNIIFLDFEYFGFDDPAKLINDFVWHPGMLTSEEVKKYWMLSMLNLFPNDQGLLKRVKASWPLYGLRWALIILKEFTRNGWSDRNYAQSSYEGYRADKLEVQLSKSRAIIKFLIDTEMECPYA
jgi:thiamine kinase-like enzyme